MTDWLSARQAADHLGISVRHLYALVHDGKLPKPVKLGRLSRWNREKIDERLFSPAQKTQTASVSLKFQEVADEIEKAARRSRHAA